MTTERSDIIILLDRSGSMQTGQRDHEGGLRSFVGDAKRLAGDVRLTFVRFDSNEPCEVVFEAQRVSDVKEQQLVLVPRGGTPLLDAVGETVTRFAPRCLGPVILMIVTDGEENQSRTWTKERVRALLREREAAGWKVLYLGANVDAFAEAGAIGVTQDAAMGYTTSRRGICNLYRALGANMTSAYAARAAGQDWGQAMSHLAFNDQQRSSVNEEDS